MTKTEIKYAAMNEILQSIDNSILTATEANEMAVSRQWGTSTYDSIEFIDELYKQKLRVMKLFGIEQ